MAYFIFKAFWFLIAILILLVGYQLLVQYNNKNKSKRENKNSKSEKEQE